MSSRLSLKDLLNPAPTVAQHPRLSVASLLNPAALFTNHSASASATPPPLLEPEPGFVYVDYRLTSQTLLKFVYVHDVGSIVEYPVTGRSSDEYVGHLFHLDPQRWSNPANDFAYSRGAPRGFYRGTWEVPLLVDEETGEMVPCTVRHSTCQGVKICPFYDLQESTDVPHYSASRERLQIRLKHDRELRAEHRSPTSDIFVHTSAFITAIRRSGCPAFDFSEDQGAQMEDAEAMRIRRGYPLRENQCKGNIVLGYMFDGTPFLKCEHYSNQSRTHFFDSTIGNGSYNLEYLEAIFTDDQEEIVQIEAEAELNSHGPRAACHTVMNSSSQRPVCPFDHRDTHGILKQPEIQRMECSCTFREYEPVEAFRKSCPYVLVVCKGPHSHPIPLPEKTPMAIKTELTDLITRLDVEMADITPRQFLRHPIVKSYLNTRFPLLRNPMLSDLHISLSNRSHLRVYIEAVKKQHFPSGTGWRGLQYLKHQQDTLLPAEDHYIRRMFEVPLNLLNEDSDDFLEEESPSSETPLRIVVCMTQEASKKFIHAQYLQSDIAFKRVVGFYEFEIASVDPDSNTSITFCRVFLTRQTAAAHCRVLKEINEVLKEDTGRGLHWRHIHGTQVDDYEGNILNWVVDQHGGQAKGIGMYLQCVAQSLPVKADFHHPLRSIQSLDPYEHLSRFLTLCTTHFGRNIRESPVTEEVRVLMRSLVCVRHESWDETLRAIEELGGVPGKNWVADKQRARFAFPGICWEHSCIPLDIWNARRRDSNISEIVHANVNQEGIRCTLVGGVKKGQHYDRMKFAALKNRESAGIRDSYQTKNLSENATRNMKRRSCNRNKRLSSGDRKIALHNRKMHSVFEQLTNTRATAETKYRAAFPSGHEQNPVSEQAQRAWEKAKGDEKRIQANFDKQARAGQALKSAGSGQVEVFIPS